MILNEHGCAISEHQKQKTLPNNCSFASVWVFWEFRAILLHW
jgi:hypothetical protein